MKEFKTMAYLPEEEDGPTTVDFEATKDEYRAETLQELLERMVREGWQLVCMCPTMFDKRMIAVEILCVFMRYKSVA